MSVQDRFPLYSPIYASGVTYAQGLHVVIGYSTRQDDTVDLVLWSTTEGEDQSPLIISRDLVTRAPTGTSPVINSSLFQSERSINTFNHDLNKAVRGNEVIYMGEVKTVVSASLIGYVPWVDNCGNIIKSADHYKRVYRVVFDDYYTGYMCEVTLTNSPF